MATELALDIASQLPNGPRIEARLHLDLSDTPVVVLFGPSGVGKTTVLRCLAGLERPSQGSIRFGDQTWFDADRKVFVAPQERNIGLMSQDYALFPHLSLTANLAYGLGDLPQSERMRRIGALIDRFGLKGLEKRRASQLSGGQQQRAALARALSRQPQLLLLDEPLSALDGPTRQHLRGELRGLLHEFAVPTVLVTHDRVEALALGDMLAVMEGGRIQQVGPVATVFNAPSNLAVARAVGVETVAPARVYPGSQPDMDGLATVEVGTARLLAVNPEEVQGAAFACIRAEDVILELGSTLRTSARNRLPGHIVDLISEGPMVRVSLDCGFPLVALVTRQSCEELGLVRGGQITACVKAPSIKLIPRSLDAHPLLG